MLQPDQAKQPAQPPSNDPRTTPRKAHGRTKAMRTPPPALTMPRPDPPTAPIYQQERLLRRASPLRQAGRLNSDEDLPLTGNAD
jgi:hypothetical protein